MESRCSLTKLLVFGGALLLLFGCATAPPYVPFPDGVTPPRTVAVLPLENQTDSETAGLFLREEMYDTLKSKGYAPTPLSEVDQRLAHEFTPSVDGDFTSDSILAIGRALVVDAVMTGAVQKFGNKGESVTEDEVEATFALFETQTGDLLWDYHGYAVFVNPTPFSPESLGAKLAESMMKRPHQDVVMRYFGDLAIKLPNGAESDHEPQY